MIRSYETGLLIMANATNASSVVREYALPLLQTLGVFAGVVAALVLVYAGFIYMTSNGQPNRMSQAKDLIRNALLGLVLVLGAAVIVGMLMRAYDSPARSEDASLPTLQAIEPKEADNGLVEVLIQAVTGFLNTIIQAVATPFLAGLDYFTKATPLMAENSSVFNLWLVMVGIANVLLVLVLTLIGFQIMSAGMFGFDDISFKHLLPRVGLVFVLMNSSIFAIDGVIELSNVLIRALSSVAGSASPWETLTVVVESTAAQGVAALLLMLVFLIFTVFLMVYYILRLVTLYIGAVLSPLVALVWLVPGFRDFSETAIKTYLTTIFVLFVHVVILQLSASLFTGLGGSGSDQLPNVLMSLLVGVATIIALLKTQGVMMQFSYVSMGARNARMLGGQFINGVSYLGGRGRALASSAGGSAYSGVNRLRGAGSSRLAPAYSSVSGVSSGGVHKPMSTGFNSGSSGNAGKSSSLRPDSSARQNSMQNIKVQPELNPSGLSRAKSAQGASRAKPPSAGVGEDGLKNAIKKKGSKS